MTDFKFNPASYEVLRGMSADNLSALFLSPKDVQLLLVAVTNYYWQTRYFDTENYNDDENKAFIAELESRLMSTLDLCQAIADCLSDENSPARQAINELVKNGTDSSTETAPFQPSTGTDRTLIVEPSCNDAILFGQVTQMVDLIHGSITQLFEMIEKTTNYQEKVGILFDNVPFLSEATDFSDQLIEEVVENYQATYDDTLRNKFRCELFCLAKGNNCTLTFNMMASYFNGLQGLTFDGYGWLEFIVQLTNGYIEGERIVYSAHSLLLGALAFGSNWLGVNVRELQRIASSFLNDPDEDYLTICDECGVTTTWYRDIDFTLSDGGFVNIPDTADPSYGFNPQGNWQAGVGFSNGVLNNSSVLTIFKNFPITGFTVTYVKVWYSSTVNNLEQKRVTLYGTPDTTLTLANTAGTHETEFLGVGSVDPYRMIIALHNSGGGALNVMKITRARFEGTGLNPF